MLPAMGKQQAAGTPAMVLLTNAGVAFTVHRYTHDPAVAGYALEAAEALGLDPEQVFKTLCIEVEGAPHVAIVPASTTLDLKHAAAAAKGKRAEMMPVAAAERLTGYVAGGISPFGQRKRLPTLLDETALLFDTIYVSGGRRGLDIGIAPEALITVLGATVADIAR